MNTQNHMVASVLQEIRRQRPLVLCLTNSVVQNYTANLLLAVGAVPVMLNHAEEIEDLLHSCANSLLINVGTLNKEQAHLMKIAVHIAAEARVPWVLDPVAVGLLRFRTQFCRVLLETPPTMIRGNASEIMALAGVPSAACRGPESGASSTEAIIAAKALALQTGAAVLVTGETDYITDGHITYSCANGHELMTRITGMGCAMGALAAGCTAVAENPLQAAIATAAIMGVGGDIAVATTPHPGTLASAILDALASITPASLQAHAKLQQLGVL